MLVVNLLKVPLQIFAWHNISWPSFALDTMMLPFIGAGAFLGIRIIRWFPEKAFRRFIQAVTVISAILMLIR